MRAETTAAALSASVANSADNSPRMVTSSEGDKVFGLEGTVELMNIISGTIIMVGSNTTGISLQTGEINLTTTDPDEVPKEDEKQDINEFEIQFEGPDGDQKTMKIRYR